MAATPGVLNGQSTSCERCTFTSGSCRTTYYHIHGQYYGYYQCTDGQTTYSMEWTTSQRPACPDTWSTCPNPDVIIAE